MLLILMYLYFFTPLDLTAKVRSHSTDLDFSWKTYNQFIKNYALLSIKLPKRLYLSVIIYITLWEQFSISTFSLKCQNEHVYSFTLYFTFYLYNVCTNKSALKKPLIHLSCFVITAVAAFLPSSLYFVWSFCSHVVSLRAVSFICGIFSFVSTSISL